MAWDGNVEEVIEFYRTNSFTITCEVFHLSYERLTKILSENNVAKHSAKENRELTSMYRFGVKNIGELAESHEKAKQTTKERYGVENFRNDEKSKKTRALNSGTVEDSYHEGVKKAKKNNMEKYGEEYFFQTSDFKEKAKKTCLDRYGVENYRNAQDYKEKLERTCLEKYGVKHYMSSPVCKEKVKATCNERFGADSWFGSNEGKQAVKESCLKKYGHENVMQSEECKRRAAHLLISKYGVENVMQVPEFRSKQATSANVSGFELEVASWLTSHGCTFSKHYVIGNVENSIIHEFDFAVFSDNKLILLIDCDGEYYHGYLDDINGHSVNPYVDEYRMLLVPEGVDFLVVLPTDYNTELEEYFSGNGKYAETVFKWCRSIEFPYPNIPNYTSSYKSLCKADVSKFSMNARYGERVIQHFHKSIWKANKKGYMSPFDAWQDDAILRKAIQNRIVYKGNSLDPSKVLYGFSAAKIAPKVSVFNPYLAKYLILKYLNEFNTIFDPCSGFSGRLLGAASLNKCYIGRDINPVTVNETNLLIDELKLSATVACQDSLLTTGTFECLFTCPPYSDKENWNQDIKNMTCDEWIEHFLKNFSCKKYLFVVDNTTKYRGNIVEELKNTSHFSNSSEYVLLFS